MTPEQVTDIINQYRKRVYEVYWLVPIGSKRADSSIKMGSPTWTTYAHILWMCDQVECFLHQDKWDKVNRWLGFIQGTLWMSGIYSIDDMRKHNR